MTLQQILQSTRFALAEPNPLGRFSDGELIDYINEAQLQTGIEVEWPEALYQISTIANQMEYQLPELLKILRVYIGNQRGVPTTIPYMEGAQIEYWDQSNVGSGYAAQWSSQTPSAYPVGSDTGSPIEVKSPYVVGSRPMYYLRGGNLGIVPAPAGSYTLSINYIPEPPPLANYTDVSIYPLFWKDALVQFAVYKARYADRQTDDATAAFEQFTKVYLPRLRQWKLDMIEDLPKGPQLITYRTYYANGPDQFGPT